MDVYTNNSIKKSLEKKRRLSDWPKLEAVTKNYFNEESEEAKQHCWIDYIPKKKINRLRKRILSGVIILLLLLAVGTIINRYPQIVERIQVIRN